MNAAIARGQQLGSNETAVEISTSVQNAGSEDAKGGTGVVEGPRRRLGV